MVKDILIQVSAGILPVLATAMIHFIQKLINSIESLNSKMAIVVSTIESHEHRIIKLEDK